MNDLGWTALGGTIKHNYILGGSNFSVSTTVHKFIVPPGRRWYLICGNTNRDVSATIMIEAYDSSDHLITRLGYATASTGAQSYPLTDTGAFALPTYLPLDVAYYIKFTFSVAQTAAGSCSALVLETPR